MNKINNVALVEWTWIGHHPTYFKLFIRAMLELGCTVLALCPKPEEVETGLQDLAPESRSRLTVRGIGWAHPFRRCPDRFKRQVQTLRSLHRLKKELRRWEAGSQKKVELVFFSCIYDAQFRYFRSAEWAFPYRWSGLYMHCRSVRMPGSPIPQTGEMPCPEIIFKSPKLHSIALLDEGARETMADLSGRPAIVFPDFTEDKINSEETPFTKKIKRFAAGAPIVSCIGYLQYTKGVATLARVALDPANSDLFFLFVGEVIWQGFTPEDRKLVASLMDQCPNVYTHFAHVPDDRIFNSVIAVSDVVFAAYIDFPHSSNILTKAAVFQKPIIVSDKYLMAERTRKYHLGEVVPEANAPATTNAIRTILRDKKAWVADRQPRWAEFCRQHSYAQLKTSFASLLDID